MNIIILVVSIKKVKSDCPVVWPLLASSSFPPLDLASPVFLLLSTHAGKRPHPHLSEQSKDQD